MYKCIAHSRLHALLTAKRMTVEQVLNSKSDLQSHSKSCVLMPFNWSHMISY